jgi:hypothetical protein
VNDRKPIELVEIGTKVPAAAAEKGNGKDDKPPRFPLTKFDDVLMTTASIYCVSGVIPRTGLVIIWGPPKCGKSFWTFDLLMHVALGWEYRGLRVRRGVVVYCVLEGAEGFRRRIEAFRKKHQEAKGADLFIMALSLDLIRDHGDLIASIRAQLPAGVNPAAVAIDTLNRSLRGSENSDEDMAAYVKAADAIRGAFDCVVPIIHHCGHGADRPRGHSSLLGALDVQIGVRRDEANNVVATVELAKDDQTGLQIVSCLVKVEVGMDDDGEVMSSLVVEPVGDLIKAPAIKGTPGGGARVEFETVKIEMLHAYDRLADDVTPTRGLDGKPARKVSVESLRNELKSAGFLETTDDGALTATGRSHFRRAKTQLLASSRLVERQGRIWR